MVGTKHSSNHNTKRYLKTDEDIRLLVANAPFFTSASVFGFSLVVLLTSSFVFFVLSPLFLVDSFVRSFCLLLPSFAFLFPYGLSFCLPVLDLFFLSSGFLPVCYLSLVFPNFFSYLICPSHLRPFFGFYKAREGRVFMPSEMRHVPWGIVGIMVHDVLVVFHVDPVFRIRRWWTVCVENNIDFTQNDCFQFGPWTFDI